MYYLIFISVFFIVFAGVLIIFFAVHQSNISNIKSSQENINSKANNSLSSSNFQITKVFYINDYATYDQSNIYKKFVAVDNEKRQICFIDYDNGILFIVKFCEILNYEIYENNNNSIVGGNLGGFGVGALGAEINGMCKELKLIIRLKRYDLSQITYDIISNTSFNMGINRASQPYKQCISTLQEFISFLEVVKNENEKDTVN